MIIFGQRTGKTLFSITRERTFGTPEHDHIAIVDVYGNGKTTIDAGHRHDIWEGTVRRAAGHAHERREPPPDVGT